MTCSAVSVLVPLSIEKKAPKEEYQLSFDKPPSYLALLDSIEQKPTALKLEQINFHIKAGKEDVLQDNWARLVGDRGAIKLEVSFMHHQKLSPIYSFSSVQHVLLESARLVPFLLQAHLSIPKHPMVTARSG